MAAMKRRTARATKSWQSRVFTRKVVKFYKTPPNCRPHRRL